MARCRLIRISCSTEASSLSCARLWPTSSALRLESAFALSRLSSVLGSIPCRLQPPANAMAILTVKQHGILLHAAEWPHCVETSPTTTLDSGISQCIISKEVSGASVKVIRLANPAEDQCVWRRPFVPHFLFLRVVVVVKCSVELIHRRRHVRRRPRPSRRCTPLSCCMGVVFTASMALLALRR